MQPIPCNHCGFNFMRQTIDPEAPRLCNSCAIREEKRSPTKKDIMKTVDIVIKCPIKEQSEIEEHCINQGINFSAYFLSLHTTFKEKTGVFAEFMKPIAEKVQDVEEKPFKFKQKKK